MRFGAPFALYALFSLPFLALFLMWGWRQKEKSLRRFVEAGLDKRLTAELSPRRRFWKTVFLFLSLVSALIALARPQWGYRWEEIKRRGVDILIAVDVSKSMLAGDVSPNRLERAKRKVEDLLNLLEGDRVGLIAFSGKAFVMTPLTLDYGAIRLFLDALSPELITAQGTNVGEAIKLALKALKQSAPENRSLVLMTDGEDLSGDALEATKKASDQGLRLYALGIGTEAGAPIPAEGGGFKKDASGEIVLTRLDESTLEKMASTTGGLYVRSVADDRDLHALYEGIRSKLEEKDLKAGREKHYIDRYAWFLFPAILLLMAEALLSETKTSRKRRLAMTSVFLLLPLLAPGTARAFSLPGKVQEGERLYRAGKYEDALEKFLAAQKDNPEDARLQYNLGNTYYQLKRYEDAQKQFEGSSKDKELEQRSLYNRGNSQFREEKWEDAIQSYENALKLAPRDEDARYNLELAKRKLEEKKQEQNKQEQNKKDQNNQQQQDQNQQKDQDKQDQNQDKKKQEQNQQQQNERQDQNQQKDQDQQKEKADSEKQNKSEDEQEKSGQNEESKSPEQPAQGQQATPGQMTREEAERWLSTLQEGKRRMAPMGRQKGKSKSDKDW